MSFRARLALVAAAAVALAVLAASFFVYFVVNEQLRSPIDQSLRASAADIQHSPPDDVLRGLFHLRAELGGAPGYPQVVKADGTIVPLAGETTRLPVNDRDREVARGEAETFLAGIQHAERAIISTDQRQRALQNG